MSPVIPNHALIRRGFFRFGRVALGHLGPHLPRGRDPRYPFDLLCRVITVSLETVRIVKGLPKLVLQ